MTSFEIKLNLQEPQAHDMSFETFLNTSSEITNSIITRLKLWNRKRLKSSRIKKLLKTDPKYRKPYPYPDRLRKILFIEAQQGWGDFLYFAGLLKSLSKSGLIIDVASLPNTFERYKRLPFIRNTFPLGDQKSIKEITVQNYDLAIDVTYVNSNHWDLRLPLLSAIRCHTLTTSDVASTSKLFDHFIDLSEKCHWSQRNALIYNSIVHPEDTEIAIPPFYPKLKESTHVKEFLDSLNLTKRIVYVNTKASAESRTLSREQTQVIIDLFNQRKSSIGIIFTDFTFEESNYVKRLPKMEFDEFSTFIQHSQAIISPDTSTVHLGSVFNIPVFGIYCGNNRDYWSQYAMQDVWAPLSHHSVSYVEDDPDASTESDFIYTHKKKSIKTYDPITLSKKIRNFLEKLDL